MPADSLTSKRTKLRRESALGKIALNLTAVLELGGMIESQHDGERERIYLSHLVNSTYGE
jgi:hypothetical protein